MCLDLLCCCCGPSACGLCCCGSKVKNSITTRLLYMTFLVFVLVVSAIMLAPTVQEWLASVQILCADFRFNQNFPPEIPIVGGNPILNVTQSALINCSQFVGYLAVYRVCIAVASFFFLLMLLMFCVFSSKDPRSYIQNGFWCIKWLLVIGLVVAFFFIPDGSNYTFSQAILGIGLTGSFIFILTQVILLVDFAHTWAETWIGYAEENDNKGWYVGMLIFSIIFYVGSLVGIILLYVFFTELASCTLNKVYISSTLILSVVISVVAILPWVQKAQPKSGLLQPSIVTAYCTYLTWSAISTEPYGVVQGTNGTEFYDCQIGSNNDTNNTSINFAVFGRSSGSALAASITGIIILFFTVGYMCFRLSSSSHLKKFRGSKKDDESSLLQEREIVYLPNNEKEEEEEEGSEDEKGRWKLHHTDDEKERVTYSYSFFHFLMMLAVLYFMMQLTNWGNPGNADSEHFENTMASVWVKMATVWLCFAIYLWTLLAPLILGNCRDFGYESD